MSRPRPGAVTAAAVLSIIYGSLCSLCGLVGVAGMAAQGGFQGGMGNNMFAAGDANQQKLQQELEKRLKEKAPAQEAYQAITSIVGLAESLALLVGGIGLLGMNRWARTLTLVAAGVAMATTTLQTVYTIAYVSPAIDEALQAAKPAIARQIPPVQQGQQVEQAMQFFETMIRLVIIVTIIVLVLILIYLFIIVMLLCKKHVRAAFAGEVPVWPDADTERLSDDRADDEAGGWGESAPPRNPDDDYRYR